MFSYLDTSSGESEFDVFVGSVGSTVQQKYFVVGIPTASTGCGRQSQQISFSDTVVSTVLLLILETLLDLFKFLYFLKFSECILVFGLFKVTQI